MANDGVPSWLSLAQLLPAGEEDKIARKELFDRLDPNGNSYLSLVEVEEGLIEQFQLDGSSEFATKGCKPAIVQAFQAAKGINGSSDSQRSDNVTRSQFRMILVHIQRYFELRAVFDEVYTGEDRSLNEEEFTQAIPKLEGWGVTLSDSSDEFKKFDSSGSGQVPFDEFAAWALKRSLEVIKSEPEEGEATVDDQDQAVSIAPDDTANEPPKETPTVDSCPVAQPVATAQDADAEKHPGSPRKSLPDVTPNAAADPVEPVALPEKPLPKPGLSFPDVTIAPVDSQPTAPYQHYLEAHSRFMAAVVAVAAA